MSGFDLKEGQFADRIVSEEELWRAFNLVFSTKTVNASSYKFVFLKSIIDCLELADHTLQLSFEQIFTRFTETYWILVVKYGIRQAVSTTRETYMEQILHDYVGKHDGQVSICYSDLTDKARESLVKKVKSRCKTYVVGALYGDTQSLFYSFSKKEEWIIINPQMYEFLKKHGKSIEELNYYELAKFLEHVNGKDFVLNLRKSLSNVDKKDDIAVYMQLLYEEFEKNTSSKKSSYEINTLDLLYAAEETYKQTSAFEKKNQTIISLYNENDYEHSDAESMMMYLGEPERIIKMLKLRKGIC